MGELVERVSVEVQQGHNCEKKLQADSLMPEKIPTPNFFCQAMDYSMGVACKTALIEMEI